MLPTPAGAIADWQVQEDGTIANAVSGALATVNGVLGGALETVRACEFGGFEALIASTDKVTVPTSGWSATAGTWYWVGSRSESKTWASQVKWYWTTNANRFLTMHEASGVPKVQKYTAAGGTGVQGATYLCYLTEYVHAFRFGPTYGGNSFCDGLVSGTTGANNAPDTMEANAYIGSEVIDANVYGGYFSRLVIFDAEHTATTVAATSTKVKYPLYVADPDIIAAMGDSISKSVGYGAATVAESWFGQYIKRVSGVDTADGGTFGSNAANVIFAGDNFTLYCAGLPSNKLTEMVARIQQDTLDFSPRSIHILGGINDVQAAATQAAMQAAIMYMTAMAQALGIRVHIGTLVPYNNGTPAQRDSVDVLNAWIRWHCRNTGAVLCDYYTPMALTDRTCTNLVDGVHPNLAGYTQMAGITPASFAHGYSMTRRVSIGGAAA